MSCESSLFLDSTKLMTVVAGNLPQTVVNILYVVLLTLGLSRTVLVSDALAVEHIHYKFFL